MRQRRARAVALASWIIVLAFVLSAQLQAAGPELADSPWPKFRQDLRNAGRSPYAGPEVPELRWTFATGDDVRSSPAIGADGTIYVGCGDNRLYAINPDGSQKWVFTTGGPVHSSPAIAADGTVYVGSFDGNLYAIESDGSLKWSFATWGAIASSPAVGADGTIYVGTDDHYLYAVEPDGRAEVGLQHQRGHRFLRPPSA
jgi:outer membrane protein assembly factor BamB